MHVCVCVCVCVCVGVCVCACVCACVCVCVCVCCVLRVACCLSHVCRACQLRPHFPSSMFPARPIPALTDRADGIRFLERVVVERESDHAEWRFPCALWFSRVQAVDAQAIDRAAARGAHRATRSVQESHMQRRAGTHAPRSSPRLAPYSLPTASFCLATCECAARAAATHRPRATGDPHSGRARAAAACGAGHSRLGPFPLRTIPAKAHSRLGPFPV